MSTKQRVQGVGETDYDTMADEQIAELMAGAPESFSDPVAEGPVIPSENSGPEKALLEPGEGKVVLRNIRYINQTIFLPVGGKIDNASKVQFQDGTLITDQATATTVMAGRPYIRQEPSEGQVYTYKGFSTRDPVIHQQWVQYYHENRAG